MVFGLLSKLVSLPSKLPSRTAVRAYSIGRRIFLSQLKDYDSSFYLPDGSLSKNLWDLEFRAPLFNAAGIFKNLDCYEVALAQGAGAYLMGTLTWFPRKGNFMHTVRRPFALYPKSHASSNSNGLPNPGIEKALKKLPSLKQEPDFTRDFPIGVNVGFSPDKESIFHLTESMRYAEKRGADFLELNLSCPNIEQAVSQMEILEFVSEEFLSSRSIQGRKRPVPVIAKLSPDMKIWEVPYIMDGLFHLGYDGIAFGNTSTDYEAIRKHIHHDELRLFDYFTNTFGGGVRGQPLREKVLKLNRTAKYYLKSGAPPQEFHVIHAGAVKTRSDLEESLKSSSLVQWLSGYSEGLVEHGNQVYAELYGGKNV